MFPHGEFIYKHESNNFQQLDEEHSRIQALLEDLASTCIHLHSQESCSACSHERHGLCHGRLPSFFHDLIDLCAIHFYREECLIEQELIGSAAHARLKEHHKAHSAVLREISQLIMTTNSALKTQSTDQAYRSFYLAVSQIMFDHDKQFDKLLLEVINHQHPEKH
jgi:hemerythrin